MNNDIYIDWLSLIDNADRIPAEHERNLLRILGSKNIRSSIYELRQALGISPEGGINSCVRNVAQAYEIRESIMRLSPYISISERGTKASMTDLGRSSVIDVLCNLMNQWRIDEGWFEFMYHWAIYGTIFDYLPIGRIDYNKKLSSPSMVGMLGAKKAKDGKRSEVIPKAVVTRKSDYEAIVKWDKNVSSICDADLRQVALLTMPPHLVNKKFGIYSKPSGEFFEKGSEGHASKTKQEEGSNSKNLKIRNILFCYCHVHNYKTQEDIVRESHRLLLRHGAWEKRAELNTDEEMDLIDYHPTFKRQSLIGNIDRYKKSIEPYY